MSKYVLIDESINDESLVSIMFNLELNSVYTLNKHRHYTYIYDDDNNFYYGLFDNKLNFECYFITFAEWRERQIKSILDE